MKLATGSIALIMLGLLSQVAVAQTAMAPTAAPATAPTAAPATAPTAAPASPSWSPTMLEKQDIQKVDASAMQAAGLAKAACGNASLSFTYDWSTYGQLDYAQAAGTPKDQVIGWAGMFADAVSKAMVDACSNPGFKAEIGKLTEVTFAPRNIVKDNYRMVFTKNMTTVHVDYNAFAKNGGQDLEHDFESVF